MRFYVFVFCFQLSSIPLITAISFVLYKVISTRDFLVSHLLVTVFMSLKDAWLGNFIANSNTEVKNVVVGAVVFITSTCLPTLVSGVLLSHIFYFLKNNHTEFLDEDEKKLLDELTLFEDLKCIKGNHPNEDTKVIDATTVSQVTEVIEVTENTKVTEPMKPVEHVEPTQPTQPTQRTQPTQPTQPVESIKSTKYPGSLVDARGMGSGNGSRQNKQ